MGLGLRAWILAAGLGALALSCNAPTGDLVFPGDTAVGTVNLRLTLPGADAQAQYPFDPTQVTSEVTFTPSTGPVVTLSPAGDAQGIFTQKADLTPGSYAVTAKIYLEAAKVTLLAQSDPASVTVTGGTTKPLELEAKIYDPSSLTGSLRVLVNFNSGIQGIFSSGLQLEADLKPLAGGTALTVSINTSTWNTTGATVDGVNLTPGLYSLDLKAKSQGSANFPGYFTSWYDTQVVAVFPTRQTYKAFFLDYNNVNQPPQRPWSEPPNGLNWPQNMPVKLHTNPSDVLIKYTLDPALTRDDILAAPNPDPLGKVFTIPVGDDISSKLSPNIYNTVYAVAVGPWGASDLVTYYWFIFPESNMIHVSPTGSDLGAGTAASPFQTLAKALTVANTWEGTSTAGWVKMAQGTYNEGLLVVGSGITIVGGCTGPNFDPPANPDLGDLSTVKITPPSTASPYFWTGGLSFQGLTGKPSTLIGLNLKLASSSGLLNAATVAANGIGFSVNLFQCRISADVAGTGTAAVAAQNMTGTLGLSQNWINVDFPTQTATGQSFGVWARDVGQLWVSGHKKMNGRSYGILGGNGKAASVGLYAQNITPAYVSDNIIAGGGSMVGPTGKSVGIWLAFNQGMAIANRPIIAKNYILGSGYPGIPSFGTGQGIGIYLESAFAEIRGNLVLGYHGGTNGSVGIMGVPAAANLVIGDNLIAGAVTPVSGPSQGLYFDGSQSLLVERNRIFSGFSTANQVGVLASTGSGTAVFHNNLIGSRLSGTASGQGMDYSLGMGETLNLVNNTVVSLGATKLDETSIALNLAGNGAGNHNLKNNLLISGTKEALHVDGSFTFGQNQANALLRIQDPGTLWTYGVIPYADASSMPGGIGSFKVPGSAIDTLFVGGTLVNTKDVKSVENFLGIDIDGDGAFVGFDFRPSTLDPWGLALAQRGKPQADASLNQDQSRRPRTAGPVGGGYNYSNLFWTIGGFEQDSAAGTFSVGLNFLQGPLEAGVPFVSKAPFLVWLSHTGPGDIATNIYCNPENGSWNKPSGSPASPSEYAPLTGVNTAHFSTWMPGTNVTDWTFGYTGFASGALAPIHVDANLSAESSAADVGGAGNPLASLGRAVDILNRNFVYCPVEIRLNSGSAGVYKGPAVWPLGTTGGVTLTGKLKNNGGGSWIANPGTWARYDSPGGGGDSFEKPNYRLGITDLNGPLVLDSLRLDGMTTGTYVTALAIIQPSNTVTVKNSRLEAGPCSVAGGETSALYMGYIQDTTYPPEVLHNWLLGTDDGGSTGSNSVGVRIRNVADFTLEGNRIYGGNLNGSRGISFANDNALTASNAQGKILNNLIVGAGSSAAGKTGLFLQNQALGSMKTKVFHNVIYGGFGAGEAILISAGPTSTNAPDIENNVILMNRAGTESVFGILEKEPNCSPQKVEYNYFWVTSGTNAQPWWQIMSAQVPNPATNIVDMVSVPFGEFVDSSLPGDKASFLAVAATENWKPKAGSQLLNTGVKLSDVPVNILGDVRSDPTNIGAY